MLTSISMANAQKAYTYVQQNGEVVDADGTAAFDLLDNPKLEFDANGNVVMTINGNTVAKLPMTDGGQLAVEFKTTKEDAQLNKVSKSVPNGSFYATIYSPFQLQVPSTGDNMVYAPKYNETKHVLQLNSDTKVENGAVIPAGTGLLVASNVDFIFSAGSSTDSHTSALSGTALTIPNPTKSGAVEGKTVYTLGQAKEDISKYGFFRYTGDNLNPGLAYLYVSTIPASVETKYVALSFDDTPTAITDAESISGDYNINKPETFKYVHDGRVVIVRNGQEYNISGQMIK